MWNISSDQAAQMYARFMKARYGARARGAVEQMIKDLSTRGDKDGERIWRDVAKHVGDEVRLAS